MAGGMGPAGLGLLGAHRRTAAGHPARVAVCPGRAGDRGREPRHPAARRDRAGERRAPGRQGRRQPLWVGVCASAGAIVGDSIGYAIGRRGGRPLFERLGRRFPKHFGPRHIGRAEHYFDRFGVWAVFVGRFIALLRILAGPLAGALRMPYWRFLVANVLGGIVWAGRHHRGDLLPRHGRREVAEGLLVGGARGGGAGGIATTWFVKRRAASPLDQGDLEGVVRGPVDM